MLLCALLLPVAAAAAPQPGYEVVGQVAPEVQASVALHGATTPFATSTLSDSSGKFRFTRLAAGQYTLSVFSPGYGEKRITIDVGPASTDSKGRFRVTVSLDASAQSVTLGGTVSVSELSIPVRARKECAEADKHLEKRDIDGAIEHLLKAVELAPGYTSAWNHLGTIAYQTRRYADAERYFRKGLETNRDSYEPLVNLGGVLLTLGKKEEAFQYNLFATQKRPRDALANAQLGMNYLALGKVDPAEKYLLEACRLDPGHFSHPQLLLAEIYVRKNDPAKAAGQLEDFLRYHPGWQNAEQLKVVIRKLRNR